MNRGRVEQTGNPRDIYEHPRTPFVADFIGSLNALDLRIDELIGANAVMRLGERERVVAAVGPGHRIGETLRIAVRPERVQIEAAGSPMTDGRSRLDGTVAETVFLGMYTQFHVDTRAGRLVSNRVADESRAPLAAGSRVTLLWEPEHASMLGDSTATEPP
jgi:spermidine/putrescine transport system ATP-binding protein